MLRPIIPAATGRPEKASNPSSRVARMATVASQADRDAVVETIVHAFDADPLWSWMFPDPARRAEQHATIFGLYVESALPTGASG